MWCINVDILTQECITYTLFGMILENCKNFTGLNDNISSLLLMKANWIKL